jgi:LmbE family N-acetylglucosaminyl deacetylase
MATLVCFHAHPDDEAIATGGSMARAADEGHRVVLVVATDGDHGEVPDDLDPDETLVDRRRSETARSAEVLGIHRVVWLGYRDSGMTGWAQNDDPASFLQASTDEAAERLAAVLREESADVLTVYDWHGNYGHPDHIKVHHVGHRAAALAGTSKVFEATMNRDHIARVMAGAAEVASQVADGSDVDAVRAAEEFDPNGPADDGNPFGMPEAELTHAVDVSAWIDRKRASIAAHASQVSDSSFFLQMPPEAFLASFGTEWFIEVGAPPGLRERWLFD